MAIEIQNFILWCQATAKEAKIKNIHLNQSCLFVHVNYFDSLTYVCMCTCYMNFDLYQANNVQIFVDFTEGTTFWNRQSKERRILYVPQSKTNNIYYSRHETRSAYFHLHNFYFNFTISIITCSCKKKNRSKTFFLGLVFEMNC